MSVLEYENCELLIRWAHADIWPTLQPILFWKGDTRALIPNNQKDEDGSPHEDSA